MKVEQSGWYKTRDGRLAEVIMMPKSTLYKAIGVIDGDISRVWLENGQLDADLSHPNDLIEYLGKERPKERKTVKMAPALYKYTDGTYAVSSYMYKSESDAKVCAGFVRWLIDTHAVEVRVEE